MYDHPPDPDIPFLKGVNIGRSRAAGFAKDVTSVVNELGNFLDSLDPIPG